MKKFLTLLPLLLVLTLSYEASAQKVFTLQSRLLQVDDSCALGPITSAGPITGGPRINSEGPFGFGVTCDTVIRSGIVATIAAQNWNNVAQTPGFFFVVWSINVTATDAGAPTLTYTFAWNNGTAQTTSTATVSGAALTNQGNGLVAMFVNSGTPTWANTVGGTIGTAVFKTSATLIRVF